MMQLLIGWWNSKCHSTIPSPSQLFEFRNLATMSLKQVLGKSPSRPGPKGPGPGPFRAWGLGDQAIFFKNNSGFALCSGRGLVFCAGVLSYVQGSSLMCRGQSFVVLFFYGVNALWRECSMA